MKLITKEEIAKLRELEANAGDWALALHLMPRLLIMKLISKGAGGGRNELQKT